ncbi:MAG: hypothetical protein ACXVNF_12000 [Neobacillus sp.]
MIPNQSETFEEFLSKSFADGVYSRELRLSKEEARFVQKKYPKASVKRYVTADALNEKSWYEINLPTPMTMVGKSVNQKDLAAIQDENQHLKQELERVKKSLTKVGMY